METKLVIFDMDGVLIDSERMYKREIGKIKAKWGLVFPPGTEKRTMGTTRAYNIQLYKELFGPEFDYQAYTHDIDVHIKDWFEHNVVDVKEGIFELIDYCEKKGIKLAVGTSSSGWKIDYSLKPNHLYEHFDFIMTGDKVENSKPDPEIYNKVIEHFGVKPEETIIIEDSNFGVLAGVRTGATCVYVPDIAPVEEENKKQAAYILDNAAKVIDIIEGKI